MEWDQGQKSFCHNKWIFYSNFLTDLKLIILITLIKVYLTDQYLILKSERIKTYHETWIF